MAVSLNATNFVNITLCMFTCSHWGWGHCLSDLVILCSVPWLTSHIDSTEAWPRSVVTVLVVSASKHHNTHSVVSQNSSSPRPYLWSKLTSRNIHFTSILCCVTCSTIGQCAGCGDMSANERLCYKHGHHSQGSYICGINNNNSRIADCSR